MTNELVKELALLGIPLSEVNFMQNNEIWDLIRLLKVDYEQLGTND